jgi:predicted Zn finger-like uncharacterized protein
LGIDRRAATRGLKENQSRLMYTQCPECHARFRVSADDLSAAVGTVRCGRCGSAFNALDWLSDTVPPALGYAAQRAGPALPADPGTASGPVAGIEFHFTADDIESVFVDPGGWTGASGAAGPGQESPEPHAFGAEPPIVVESESRPFEDITLEGERIDIEAILGIEAFERAPGKALVDESQVDWNLAEEDLTDQFEVLRDVPDSAYPEEDDTQNRAVEIELPAPDVPGAPLATGEPAPATAFESVPDAAPTLSELLATEPGRRRPGGATLAWSIGGLLLALGLLAQITHHYRQDLVRHPQIGPVLRDVYARLGWPLSPNWDLDAFELRQWGSGGSPDASGVLTVRASLSNRAAFAQPHPVLHLELADRFGDSVAVRDFEPAEYLKNPAEASRLLGPGASAEAELVVVDPRLRAVGYQLDVCLRESPRILLCARGP